MACGAHPSRLRAFASVFLFLCASARNRLPTLAKEIPQQRRRLRLAHPGIDLGPVERLGVLEHPRTVLDRAALGIGRGVIQPGDARVDNRARAHGARLERDPQLAAFQPLVTKRQGGGANRRDLGMRGRIVRPARRVAAFADHNAILDHHRADRHHARGGGRPREIERARHRVGERPVSHRRGVSRAPARAQTRPQTP